MVSPASQQHFGLVRAVVIIFAVESQSVRLFLELPGELVVMEVPNIKAQRRFVALDAVQLPFPPPYDSSVKGIASSSNPYQYDSGSTRAIRFYQVTQLPFPPPYDPGNRNL